MAATESWALDGVALMSGNFGVLELTADPPKARFDWVSAADSEGAGLMRQPLHENRTFMFRMRVMAQASMDAAMDQVGVIRDKLRSASSSPTGVPLVWTPANSTRSITFDVVAGEITELPISMDGQGRSWFMQRPIFTLELTAKPYGRAAEVLTSTTSSTSPVLTMALSGVPGDIPALGRLIVTDLATQSRRHVEWGLENRYYNAATSLIVDSDSMVTSGFGGTGNTRTGAYDPGAAGNSVIRANVGTDPIAICGLGSLAHVGAFRVKARVWTDSLNCQFRLAWQDGDGPFVANAWTYPPVASAFSEIDLGVVTIRPKTLGTQHWTGRIEAVSTNVVLGDTADIDTVFLIPASDGYGVARGTQQSVTGVVTARDSFSGATPGSALNARTPPLGAAWVTAGGSATDFTASVDTNGKAWMQRATTTETTAGSGRWAVVGSAMTDQFVRAAFHVNNWGSTDAPIVGVVLRYTNTSNYVVVRLAKIGSAHWLQIVKTVAGTQTTLFQDRVALATSSVYALRATVYASGVLAVWLETEAGNQLYGPVIRQDTALATGGTLASGKGGVYDQNAQTASITRKFSDMAVGTPVPEGIVLFSGRAMEIRHDTTIRQDSAGTLYGQAPSYNGTRFLVPTGDSRIAVKARRQNVSTSPDEFLADNLQVQVGYTPRVLVVPR